MTGIGGYVVGNAPRRSRRRGVPWRGLLALLVGAVLLLRFLFFELVEVRGMTMAPTAMEGDILLIEQNAAPAIGDVVLVEPPEGPPVLRRVLAFGGSQVRTEDGLLFIDEAPARVTGTGIFAYIDRESGVSHVRRQQLLRERIDSERAHPLLGGHAGAGRPYALRLEAITVEPDHLFLLCDNRPACPREETAGSVPRSWVSGVARWLMWYGDAREGTPSAPAYGAFEVLSSSALVSASGGGDGSGSPRK